MKIDKDTQFALGKTLRALDEADGLHDDKIEGVGIAKVEVDGEVVDAKQPFQTVVHEESSRETSGASIRDRTSSV